MKVGTSYKGQEFLPALYFISTSGIGIKDSSSVEPAGSRGNPKAHEMGVSHSTGRSASSDGLRYRKVLAVWKKIS